MIDLKKLLSGKIDDINTLVSTIVKSHNLTRFNNVKDLLSYNNFSLDEKYLTGKTLWLVTNEETPFSVNNGLYLKAKGEVYVEDFNDGKLSQSEYVSLANEYCMFEGVNSPLIFDANVDYIFNKNTSFVIFVESGGWYAKGNCNLHWESSPSQGFAIKVRGRYDYSDSYTRKVNNSNYRPLEGFNIGQYHAARLGIGLQIGHADSMNSMSNASVTSKFSIHRVSVFDFDDTIAFFPGVWACELNQCNTMGGSIQSPRYFGGLDFGESIKLTNCFIADNHSRLVDQKPGAVYFNTGEFIINGCSFDNMRVVVDGDACVKMFAPHFENPMSTATEKRFLEVIGNHAFCVLNAPQIVIRDTPIYSTLFYCKAHSNSNRHPASGGLVLISPSYQSKKKYRPDLAKLMDSEDVIHGSDGFLELVGGGGSVQLYGGVSINSLFYTYFPIPIARNLVGASIANYSFSKKDDKNKPLMWECAEKGGAIAVSSEKYYTEDSALQLSFNENSNGEHTISQIINCGKAKIAIGYLKYTSENSITLKIIIKYLDSNGREIPDKYYKKINTANTSNWENSYIVDIIPDGAYKMNVIVTTLNDAQSSGVSRVIYYDSLVLNCL